MSLPRHQLKADPSGKTDEYQVGKRPTVERAIRRAFSKLAAAVLGLDFQAAPTLNGLPVERPVAISQ